MGVPAKMHYPVPAGARRQPTNNCWATTSGKVKYDRFHGGSDIKPSKAGQTGEAVEAAWRGVTVFVAKAGTEKPGTWGSDYGNRILIRHSFTHRHSNGTVHKHDWFTFYAHLKSLRVTKSGVAVVEGALLAGVGNTGQSSAPHVHFALQMDPGYKVAVVDPFWRLEAARKELLGA